MHVIRTSEIRVAGLCHEARYERHTIRINAVEPDRVLQMLLHSLGNSQNECLTTVGWKGRNGLIILSTIGASVEDGTKSRRFHVYGRWDYKSQIPHESIHFYASQKDKNRVVAGFWTLLLRIVKWYGRAGSGDPEESPLSARYPRYA